MKKIAILTSGGDAPGMNAAIRAVAKSAIHQNLQVFGILNGYQGLINNLIKPLSLRDVGDIINRGGTILGSARALEFLNPEVQQKAKSILLAHGVEGLVVIGGDGSYKGALALNNLGLKCVGLPGTIDNDITSTDYTIGFDTALNTVVDAVDKLRDTSSSHHRVSIIEIMGRYCGDLTIGAGISCGVEQIITPETQLNIEELVLDILRAKTQGKTHYIIAITEKITNADELARIIEEKTHCETRSVVLGHLQRGGKPSARDRILASRMGAYAVNLLLQDISGVSIGINNDQIIHHPLGAEIIHPTLYSQTHAIWDLLV